MYKRTTFDALSLLTVWLVMGIPYITIIAIYSGTYVLLLITLLLIYIFYYKRNIFIKLFNSNKEGRKYVVMSIISFLSSLSLGSLYYFYDKNIIFNIFSFLIVMYVSRIVSKDAYKNNKSFLDKELIKKK